MDKVIIEKENGLYYLVEGEEYGPYNQIQHIYNETVNEHMMVVRFKHLGINKAFLMNEDGYGGELYNDIIIESYINEGNTIFFFIGVKGSDNFLLETDAIKLSKDLKGKSFKEIILVEDIIITDEYNIKISVQNKLDEQFFGGNYIRNNTSRAREASNSFITYEIIDPESVKYLEQKSIPPKKAEEIGPGKYVIGYTKGSNQLRRGYVKRVVKNSDASIASVWILDDHTRELIRLSPYDLEITIPKWESPHRRDLSNTWDNYIIGY